MIKNIIIFIVTSLLLLSCAGINKGKSSQKFTENAWQSQAITIDGNNKDWPSPYPNYDGKARVAYATSNDRENLYLTMETGDEITQMKILTEGMTVSIDTNGKRLGQMHIGYPLKNENAPAVPIEEFGMRKETLSAFASRQHEQQINKAMQEANQFSLEGFRNCSGGYLISQTTSCGIKIKARIDEYNELVWEAAIPFTAIYGDTTSIQGRPVSVCFTIKGFYNPSVKNRPNNANTRLNSDMAGMNNHEQRQMNVNASVQSQYLYETTKTWKQFIIAGRK